jgi:hypothetical protein
MMLGLSLSAFTILHVIISLVAIVAGLFVMFGLLGNRISSGWTSAFLVLTIITSVTGFMFPFVTLLPSHILGIISLVLLAVACFAFYSKRLSGSWRWIYVVTAMLSFYLNAFVLIIQSFLKIGPLHALAPGNPPAGLAFAAVQGIVLVLFAVAIIGAVRRFRPIPVLA